MNRHEIFAMALLFFLAFFLAIVIPTYLITISKPSLSYECRNGVVFSKHIHENFWRETTQKCVGA
jgi:hypothetical protein